MHAFHKIFLSYLCESETVMTNSVTKALLLTLQMIEREIETDARQISEQHCHCN